MRETTPTPLCGTTPLVMSAHVEVSSTVVGNCKPSAATKSSEKNKASCCSRVAFAADGLCLRLLRAAVPAVITEDAFFLKDATIGELGAEDPESRAGEVTLARALPLDFPERVGDTSGSSMPADASAGNSDNSVSRSCALRLLVASSASASASPSGRVISGSASINNATCTSASAKLTLSVGGLVGCTSCAWACKSFASACSACALPCSACASGRASCFNRAAAALAIASASFIFAIAKSRSKHMIASWALCRSRFASSSSPWIAANSSACCSRRLLLSSRTLVCSLRSDSISCVRIST
mmetsp:Transcript_55818/g.161668  ORF Transcript_55818/g.161668 Transcript_55818/m.161668 type:complete len:299 (-) Transcript_55818:1528-2424(-)